MLHSVVCFIQAACIGKKGISYQSQEFSRSPKKKRKKRKGKKGKKPELHTLYAYYIFAKAQAIQVGNGKSWGSSLGLWLENIL